MDGIQIFQPFFIYPVALISLFLLSSLITKWLNKPNTKNFPPSPRKLPIIGNLHQVVGSFPHQKFRTLSLKHGPLMLLHFGSAPVLIVSSAEMAQEIMKTHELNLTNRPLMKAFKKLLYNGKDVTFLPYGELWRQLKSILVVHLLSTKRVQSFCSIRKDETAVLVEKIREYSSSSDDKTRVINLTEMFNELTNNGICRPTLGMRCSETEKGKKLMMLLKDISEITGTVRIGEFFPSLGWINHVNGFDKRVDRIAKEINDFLEDVIQQHVETSTKGENGDQDFVDILIEILNDTTNVAGASLLDRDCIKALILDALIGGTESLTTFLDWVMAELLRNPSVMKKLQREVRDVMGDKQDITDDDLEKMEYMKAVIKETFRCHPPGAVLIRSGSLEDVKIKGYDISQGTMVVVNVWAIGRDPAFWYEPEKFEPERFLNKSMKNIDFKGLDFELIPFGAGRRGCPGISFAIATIEFVLANLVLKFNWELPNGVKGQDLDMSEGPGSTVHRAVPLLAVATQN